MFFTKDDYKKIAEYLRKIGVKDSDFEITEELKDEDSIPIIQDGKNKRIPADKFTAELSVDIVQEEGQSTSKVMSQKAVTDKLDKKPSNEDLNNFKDTINTSIREQNTKIETNTNNIKSAQTQIDALVSRSDVVDVVANKAALDSYDKGSITENDVIKVLKDESRDNAITYYRLVSNQWIFIGSLGEVFTKEEANIKFQDKLLNSEDTTIENNKILLANREAVVINQGGPKEEVKSLGYVILRKDKTFAEQITKPNTIYEIRYDFDLKNDTVTIPPNCVLKFEGGSLNNGFLSGYNTTVIVNGTYPIFKDVYLFQASTQDSGKAFAGCGYDWMTECTTRDDDYLMLNNLVQFEKSYIVNKKNINIKSWVNPFYDELNTTVFQKRNCILGKNSLYIDFGGATINLLCDDNTPERPFQTDQVDFTWGFNLDPYAFIRLIIKNESDVIVKNLNIIDDKQINGKGADLNIKLYDYKGAKNNIRGCWIMLTAFCKINFELFNIDYRSRLQFTGLTAYNPTNRRGYFKMNNIKAFYVADFFNELYNPSLKENKGYIFDKGIYTNCMFESVTGNVNSNGAIKESEIMHNVTIKGFILTKPSEDVGHSMEFYNCTLLNSIMGYVVGEKHKNEPTYLYSNCDISIHMKDNVYISQVKERDGWNSLMLTPQSGGGHVIYNNCSIDINDSNYHLTSSSANKIANVDFIGCTLNVGYRIIEGSNIVTLYNNIIKGDIIFRSCNEIKANNNEYIDSFDNTYSTSNKILSRNNITHILYDGSIICPFKDYNNHKEDLFIDDKLIYTDNVQKYHINKKSSQIFKKQFSILITGDFSTESNVSYGYIESGYVSFTIDKYKFKIEFGKDLNLVLYEGETQKTKISIEVKPGFHTYVITNDSYGQLSVIYDNNKKTYIFNSQGLKPSEYLDMNNGIISDTCDIKMQGVVALESIIVKNYEIIEKDVEIIK